MVVSAGHPNLPVFDKIPLKNKQDQLVGMTDDLAPDLRKVGMVTDVIWSDVNGDGFRDVMMIGNDYGNEVFTGRSDAHVGLVLSGNGKGEFTPINVRKSGFLVPGDGRALVRLNRADQSSLYIASQNRGELLAFQRTSGPHHHLINLGSEAMAVIFTLENGKQERVETSLGSGFLSQSSRQITLPKGIKAVQTIDFSGIVKDIEIQEWLDQE